MPRITWSTVWSPNPRYSSKASNVWKRLGRPPGRRSCAAKRMLDAYKKRKGSWAEYESQFWWTWEWSNTVGTLRRQKTALSIKEPHAAFTASHLDTSGDCFSASRAPAWRRYSGLRCCLLD